MPEKKTRLSQMIIDRQKARGITDREAAAELGVLQQTFNTWKRGAVPRSAPDGLLTFLDITSEAAETLLGDARETGGVAANTPAIFAISRAYGRISDRKEGKFKFDTSRKAVPQGRYAVVVDTKVMEPVFLVGSKVWLDPGIWPKPGNDVIAHANGFGWIGRLVELGSTVKLERYAAEPIEIKGVDAVHTIVLAERVA